MFVNKASPFINDVSDVSLQLRYRVTHARVLDANRKFADAALRYYELSKINTINVSFFLIVLLMLYDIIDTVYLCMLGGTRRTS